MSECLLIVDVQVGFIDEATKHIPKLVTELQKKYRYVYVTRFYNKEDSFYRQLVKWNRFDKGSDDFQLAFKPLTDAVIIDKSIYSCVNSNFLQELNNNKIDSVDVCGIDTDICVTKCAVDLFGSLGFKVDKNNRVVLLNYILLRILKFHNPAANKIVKSFTNGI